MQNSSTRAWGQWSDCGAVSPQNRHVRHVVNESGDRAILKTPRSNSRDAISRFADEVHGMVALSGAGTVGVLATLDADQADPPRWFVMPQAKQLGDALATPRDLREVVIACEHLASTLIRLSAKGIAHRDIKPANLFWYEGEPVLADFGIAAWPDRSRITRIGDKVGPAYFIAPEMRRRHQGADDFRADVWSLAKTLFVLARYNEDAYPPDGTHYVLAPEFSLWRVGQDAALDLAPVLEAATQFDPPRRMTMGQFVRELRDWLEHYPAGSVERARGPFRRGWRAVEFDMVQFRRRRAALRESINAAIRSVASQMQTGVNWDSDDAVATSESVSEPPVESLGDYGFPDDDDSQAEPDGSYQVTTRVDTAGLRVFLGGLIFGEDVILLGEVQRLDGGQLTVQIQLRKDAKVLLPSCKARLAEMCGEALEWRERYLVSRGT